MELTQPKLFSNRSLVRLLLPLVIEQALAVLVGMCDTVMVSSVSEAAISGVSLVDMINCVIINVFAALATGGAVVTSQLIGAKRRRDAESSAGQLVFASAVFGIAIAALCLAFAGGMLRLFFGAVSQQIMDAALTYFRITALSYPFLALYNAGAAIFRSHGNSKISMQVSIIMNIINVAGNAICIYGLRMGVAGVALPTLVSRMVAAAIILILAARPQQAIVLRARHVFRPQMRMIRRILYIGVPSALENCFFQLGRVVVVSMITRFGDVHTAANAVANTLDAIGYQFGNAVGLGVITVIGQCMGAGEPEQAKYYARKLLLLVYVIQGAINVLLTVFTWPLVGLYRSLSPEAASLAVLLVRIHSLEALVFWPPAFVLPHALRAADDVRYTLIVSVLSMAIWRVGFSWILCVQCEMGAVGVWIAMGLDWVCRCTFFVPRYLRGGWLKHYHQV